MRRRRYRGSADMLPPVNETPETPAAPEGERTTADVKATGYKWPVRAVAVPQSEAVMVDIIDRYTARTDEGDDGNREGPRTIHIGTDVIINGQRTYTPADSKVTVETCGTAATKVTITFYARRVRIGHEDELPGE